jgi:hypothetical protein
MIIAHTKLKKIPEKCSKCKFCVEPGGWGSKVNKSLIADRYKLKSCSLTGIKVPYIYNEEKRNWEYTKCKTCPLEEVEIVI